LKCPLNVNGRGDKLEPYSTFIDNVSRFRTYNALLVALNFGEGTTTFNKKQYGTNHFTIILAGEKWKD